MYTAARAALGDAALATPALTRAIVDRSLRYTSERHRLASPADRVADLAARAAFFTVADAMKIAIPLGELANRGALPAQRPLRVLDLGAGCGAMSLGLLAALADLPDLPDLDLDITAIDRDTPALAIASAAVRDFASRANIRAAITTRTADALSVPLGPPDTVDLVVMGTLLNELPADRALGVVERALGAISADGAVIIIEPALRDTSRALHELRDSILRRNTGHVFAPCTRRCAPCPALADPSDWCHEDRALALPPRTAELARLTHLRDSGMKFSYLVLRGGPLSLVESEPAWRIVSAPRPAKGKLEIIGCSERGRLPLRLLRRHRTPANRAIERADRGDVLILEGDRPDDSRVEIDDATRVERCEPARRR